MTQAYFGHAASIENVPWELRSLFVTWQNRMRRKYDRAVKREMKHAKYIAAASKGNYPSSARKRMAIEAERDLTLLMARL